MTHSQDGPAVPPLVSVVIAVHNGMPYVEAAVRSMMGQSLRAIEIIVVDDASTDATPQVLARLAAEDPRLRVFTHERNLGPTIARNRALAAARAPYIAVMDGDDISMPHRLQVQKDYLDAHPEVIMVASSNRRIDPEGRVTSVQRRALDPVELRWRLRFGMPLVHPSLMFRRQDGDGERLTYDPDFPVAQDFEFLTRVAEKGQIVSLPDVLVDWRWHGASISATKLAKQLEAAEICARRLQRRDWTEAQRRDLAPFLDIVFGRRKVTLRNAAHSIKAVARLVADDVRLHPRHAAGIRCQAVSVLFYHLAMRGIGTERFGMLLLLLSPRLFRAALDERRRRRTWRRRYLQS